MQSKIRSKLAIYDNHRKAKRTKLTLILIKNENKHSSTADELSGIETIRRNLIVHILHATIFTAKC